MSLRASQQKRDYERSQENLTTSQKSNDDDNVELDGLLNSELLA